MQRTSAVGSESLPAINSLTSSKLITVSSCFRDWKQLLTKALSGALISGDKSWVGMGKLVATVPFITSDYANTPDRSNAFDSLLALPARLERLLRHFFHQADHERS